MELRRKGVTLELLWLEYKQAHPIEGYQYSQFCFHYRQWRQAQNVVTSPNHTAVLVTPVVVCGLRMGEIIDILPFLTLRTLRHVLTSAEQRC
jgi:hypothetical protein